MKTLLAAALVAASLATPAPAKDLTSKEAVAIGTFLATLATPDPEAQSRQRACEQWIKDNAIETSPATYQFVAAKSLEPYKIRITYDAQNVYGALIRYNAVCSFDDRGNLQDGSAMNVRALSKALKNALPRP